MINLDRFNDRTTQELVILAHNGNTSVKRRRIPVSLSNGWYWAKINNDGVESARVATLSEIESSNEFRKIRGWTLNNSFIPLNFDEASKRFNFDIGNLIRCNVGEFEDWMPYEFYVTDYNIVGAVCPFFRMSVHALLITKKAYNEKKPLPTFITPELKVLYALASFNRIQEEMKVEEVRKQALLATTEGRLTHVVDMAGGRVISFKIRQDIIEVLWEVDGIKISSLIDKETFQCREAGFCISRQDSRLRIDAAVLTAKEHIDRKILYKTRSTGDSRTGYVQDREDDSDDDDNW